MIALIDADSFFASCELSRNPHLRGKPVMVLGRIGSFILAKTHEAKQYGVNTVMPYWEAKQKCPQGIFIEGDFRFYTQVSRRLMKILKNWSPLVQVSSIDEAYMDLTGIDKMRDQSFESIGDAIREDVWQQLGITVTVGIAPNKVLAKMACEQKKPNGTALLLKPQIPHFLSQIEVGDIPGIGRGRQLAVKRYGIHWAKELSELPMSIIKNLFGRNGILLWKELHGEYMFKVDGSAHTPKQIGRTSSLEKPTSNLKIIEGLAFYHLERSIESLHRHKLAVGDVNLYLRDRDFKRLYLTHSFSKPTDDFFKLARQLQKLIWKIPPGRWWRSAGILFTGLSSANSRQLNLFEDISSVISEEKLNQAKDELNKRYGQFALSSASHLFYEKRKKKSDELRLGLI